MAATQPARAASGGVMLDGRWPYVSGIDDATWVMPSARDPAWSDTNRRAITCLIPRGTFEIDDDWHVMGLRGTGSKSALLSELFVPKHRVLSFRETDSAGVPGAAVNAGPYYRGIPTSTLFVMVIAAPAFGIAACAIDAYHRRLHTRSNPRMSAPQTEWPTAQIRLGRACALYFGAVDGLCAWIGAGGELSVENRQRMRLAVVEAVGIASSIVYDLFCDAGTGVIREGDTLQRCFRDIHALRSHFMLNPDPSAENAGRVQLGLRRYRHSFSSLRHRGLAIVLLAVSAAGLAPHPAHRHRTRAAPRCRRPQRGPSQPPTPIDGSPFLSFVHNRILTKFTHGSLLLDQTICGSARPGLGRL